MFNPDDTCSISDFVRNARAHVARLRATRRPQILTLNGAAEFVVLTAEAFKELTERIDELETLAALNEASLEVDGGGGSSAEEAEARLRERLKLP
jgi:PHD/YefM family antitoxin component YafN of YafNO toxin-antitoxin module